jgi:hypothetical protein
MSDLELELEAFIDSLDLRYFKGSELTPYWSRKRGDVSNSCPPKELWGNIVPTLVVLDEIRHMMDFPITLTSTYRSKEYNAAVGGEKKSYHMSFMAIDFQGGRGPSVNAKAAKLLRGKVFKNPDTRKKFTFAGGIGKYRTFVHIDTRGFDANW